MITDPATLTKRISKIEKLRVRTTDRNATQAEEDTAALLIGRELMRFPDLEVRPRGHDGDCPPPPPDHSIEVNGSEVTIFGVQLIHVTARAMLWNVPRLGETWFLKSQVVSVGRNSLTVKRWICERVNA